MKYKEVMYSETFQHNTGFRKLHLIGELEPDDTVRDCFYKCMREVQSFYYESTKSEDKKKETLPTGNLIEDINSCKDIKMLNSYKLLVKNKPDLQSVWDAKEKELKK